MLFPNIRPKTNGSEKPEITPITDSEVPSGVIGVTLFDRAHNGCCFPMGRVEGQQLFCGASRRDPKTSYCSDHHPIVWRKRRAPDGAV